MIRAHERRSAKVVPIAALAAVVLSACGGESGVSRAEFIAQADAICLRANDKVDVRPKAGDIFQIDQPDSYRRVVRYYSNLVTAERIVLKELHALELPKEDREPINAFLSALERMIAYADRSLEELRESDLAGFRNSTRINELFDLTSQVELRTSRYGFDDCTQLGIR